MDAAKNNESITELNIDYGSYSYYNYNNYGYHYNKMYTFLKDRKKENDDKSLITYATILNHKLKNKESETTNEKNILDEIPYDVFRDKILTFIGPKHRDQHEVEAAIKNINNLMIEKNKSNQLEKSNQCKIM